MLETAAETVIEDADPAFVKIGHPIFSTAPAVGIGKVNDLHFKLSYSSTNAPGATGSAPLGDWIQTVTAEGL